MNDTQRLSSARDRILAALEAAGPAGMTNVDICHPDIGGLRGGARLGELKRSGLPIQKERLGGGVWRYWLNKEPMAKKKTQTPSAPVAKKPGPFTTIGALSSTRPLSYKDIHEQGWPYNAYLVNRAFSMTEDTVMLAAMMNERATLHNDLQATFYIHAVRPRNRYGAWPKEQDEADLSLIADYYGMSLREARLFVGLHTVDQLAEMRRLLQHGGRLPRRYP